MKKFLSVMACMVMILVSAVALTACGAPQTNSYITPSTGANFPGSVVEYKNCRDFTLEYKGKNHYVAKGTANTMTEEQATEMSTSTGAKFVVLNVKMNLGDSATIGWRSNETKNAAFEESEIDNETICKVSAENDSKNIILVLSNGIEMNHQDLKIWRIEVKKPAAEEAVVCTIDFSGFYTEE